MFLGRDIGQRRQVSEQTARLVDSEVKRILDEAHELARVILREHEPLMEAIAEALLQRETLDREEVELLAEGKTLPPLRSPAGPRAVPNPPLSPAAVRKTGEGGVGDLSPSMARGRVDAGTCSSEDAGAS